MRTYNKIMFNGKACHFLLERQKNSHHRVRQNRSGLQNNISKQILEEAFNQLEFSPNAQLNWKADN